MQFLGSDAGFPKRLSISLGATKAPCCPFVADLCRKPLDSASSPPTSLGTVQVENNGKVSVKEMLGGRSVLVNLIFR